MRGRATLALAQYLKMKGEFVESLKKPADAAGRENSCSGFTGRNTWVSSAQPILLRCSARPIGSSPA